MPSSPLDIPRLIARRRPGHTLEAPFYNSPEIHALDVDLIFGRNWVFAAVEPDVTEPGDYTVVDIGTNSIIILRDDDMQIRAFHNVCRHRGARLIQDTAGFVGNLVCPYHQWTYDLTGALIHTLPMQKDFDPACHGLKPVHVRNMAGLLFVCLADEPPADFDEMAAILTPYLAPHDLPNLKVAATIDLIEHGNWKLTIENNRECYHCGGHPELLRSLFHFFGYTEDAVAPNQRAYYERFCKTSAEFEGIWDAAGLPWKAIEQLDGRPTGFRTERLPLDDAGESYTMDTKAASKKLLGAFTSAKLGTLHLHTQPNAWYHFLGDHIVTFSVLPLAADRGLVRTKWMVHKDAVEGVDYDLDNLTKVWRATNEQDGTFVGYAQTGIGSAAYEPGPYAPAEYMVDKFVTWYIERLAAGQAGVRAKAA
ncbi:MAG TPA: aromatic ring-hydroxylating dioxygenase subunit alpha [Acetobacteraceae bacterium]|nr:aromatic ring-hydroxylating dioxygenase subunit alpha [Acetobacteraceae bacterium]